MQWDPRARGRSPRSSLGIGKPEAYSLCIEGGITVDIGSKGVVRVVVTGLDTIGNEDSVPMLVKMDPDEARELAEALIDAARRTEAE